MHDDKMTPHKRFPVLIALASVTLSSALAACGGGDDESTFQSGQLTDPRSVPTASPWDEPPEIDIIDPNDLVPITTPAPTGDAGGNGTEPGVCGSKYTIASGDTFSLIADKCGFTTQEVKDANPGVDPLTLRVGQEINLPATVPEPSP
jgi:LysM repeat protein